MSPNSTNFEMIKRDIQRFKVGVANALIKHTLWTKPPLASSCISADGANFTKPVILKTAKQVFQRIMSGLDLMGARLFIHFLSRNTSSR